MLDLKVPYQSFEDFVHEKNKNSNGFIYDFFAREWSCACFTCGEEIYAPNKKDLKKTLLSHTRNNCRGGW